MYIITHDNTFAGLMSAIFDIYDQKLDPVDIVPQGNNQAALFSNRYHVLSNNTKAQRVWDGLCRRITPDFACKVYHVFLSELPESGMLAYRYCEHIFSGAPRAHLNMGNPHVLEVQQMSQKICREAQRVTMFARFNQMIDDTYFAPFEPQYNVLPLTTEHFTQRFADQKWVVYDTRRDFGYYYDLHTSSEIRLSNSPVNMTSGHIPEPLLSPEEQQFQHLWKNYFDSVNIKERKNLKSQIQHMPKRFWKYLPEKK